MSHSTTWGMTSDPADDWREAALCRPAVHKRPEMFYPLGIEKGYTTAPAVEAGKAFCKPCPVRERCLAYALKRGEEWGIWGGLTPAERKHLRIRQILTEQFPPAQELARELGEPTPRRRPAETRPKQANCRQGHPLSGNNLRLTAGKRACKACHAERQAKLRARRREAVAHVR